MAVQLRTPSDLLRQRDDKNKKSAPFGLKGIGRVLAGVSSGGLTEVMAKIPDKDRAAALAAAGTGAGLIAGGPSGAALGGNLGSAAGSLSAATADQTQEQIVDPASKQVPVSQNAAQRRIETIQESPIDVMKQGMIAANTAPPEIKNEALQALMPAFVKSVQRRRV